MVSKAAWDYVLWLAIITLGAFLLSGAVATLPLPFSEEFAKSNYLDGLVAFNTGASIAVFLALIQSNETYIKKLRLYPRASWNVYITVFLNTFLVVAMYGLAASQAKVAFNIGVDNLVVVVATLLTFYTLYRVKTLLELYLKNN